MLATAPNSNARLWLKYSDALRRPERLSPSQFAEKYRVLHASYCSERPGRWRNTVFPHQAPIMDMVEEAISTGKRGVVIMKSGQGGGTDLAINAMCWLKRYYPGPQLFMTSTEKVAEKFGRERWEQVIRDMPPLREKYLAINRKNRGKILTKRFEDGEIEICGGGSVNNLQSTPYRHVCIDELDSLTANLGGEGDPLALAEVRTDAFTGPSLIVAYAHPTTMDRGAAKLFFELSDQRRGFITHGSCSHQFPLRWDDVKNTKENDPGSYVYACPGCGEVIGDAERTAMVRNIVYKSVLSPEEAAKKTWIGGHFGQLGYPGKSIRSLASRWVACGAQETKIRVFFNKVLGEPYEPKVQGTSSDNLRKLTVVRRRQNDREFYSRGQVPPAVRFLTAGQDSRTTELHYTVWGWGLRRKPDQTTAFCGWLIDWGIAARKYSVTFEESEYHVFDDLIYRRRFPSSVSQRNFHVIQCGHDIGYQPTQIPIVQYVRHWPNRAFAIKGASETPTSALRADYMRLGNSIAVKIGEETVRDAATQPWLANTYQLKTEWYGMVDKRIEIVDPDANGEMRTVPLLTLPEDVDDTFIDQACSEYLSPGKKDGEMVWKHKGPNHYADCNTYAFGLALNLNPGQYNKTSDEHDQQKKKNRPLPGISSSRPRDAEMG